MAGVHESSSLSPDVRRAIQEARRLEKLNTPPGSIQMWPGATNPVGWLMCDGSAISRTFYADLFRLFGITYGAGDGSTTFNLPDLRGRTVIGVGTGTGLTARALAANVGAETHLLSAAESGVAAHSHTQTAHTHTVDVVDQSTSSGSVPNRGLVTAGGGAKSGVINTLAPTIQDATAAAAAAAHNNMQPSLALNFIIKT